MSRLIFKWSFLAAFSSQLNLKLCKRWRGKLSAVLVSRSIKLSKKLKKIGFFIKIYKIFQFFCFYSWESKFCLKDFLFQLKQILNSLKFDLEVQNILKSAIKRFVFIHLFHCKFTEILNSFLVQKMYSILIILISIEFHSDYREDHSSKNEAYLKNSKEMSWLLFIVLQSFKIKQRKKLFIFISFNV